MSGKEDVAQAYPVGRGDRRQSPRPIEVNMYTYEADKRLGFCDACLNHRHDGPYQKTEDGKLMIFCTNVEGMVCAQVGLTSEEECPYSTKKRFSF